MEYFCGDLVNMVKCIKSYFFNTDKDINMAILRLYTDGGCSGNQSDENLGGWGTILEFGEHQKELYGKEKNTTNNRMEITAVLEGFKALKHNDLDIEVFSDSAYVVNCFKQKWYVKWQKNGWKNSKKEPVENRELWQELISYVEKNRVTFCKVKGHVNVDSPSTNLDKHFATFKKHNGNKFTRDDFIYITRMNNRADELVNIGIDELR